MIEKIVNISAEYGDVRGCLVDFITKDGKTYGIIKIGSKFEEVDLDKITIIENV